MENQSPKKREFLPVRIICTPSLSAKNTFFYIQETGCLKAKDIYTTHRNNLDSFLIVAVTDGKGELTTGNQTFQISKGDCFFIDCRKEHNYRSSSSEPWELLWIHFNGATSQQYYEYFLSQSKNVFRPVFFEKIVSSINEIININKVRTNNTEPLTSRLIVDILTLAVTENTTQYDTALKQKLASVNRYIEEHFNEELSLEKLSSEFYISKYYLTREYKKVYGKTIFQHIINARINYGKKLLRFSDKSVEEIAHLCGFNDQSYFSRQFKKAENLTCFSYRKKWRE